MLYDFYYACFSSEIFAKPEVCYDCAMVVFILTFLVELIFLCNLGRKLLINYQIT